MCYPLSLKDKTIAFLATAVLLTTVAKADSGDFFDSSSRNSHISGNFPLYIDKDTGWLSPADERISSKYVRRERNSDLAILVLVKQERRRLTSRVNDKRITAEAVKHDGILGAQIVGWKAFRLPAEPVISSRQIFGE